MSFANSLPSPGLTSGRRKPKNLPSLPLSAFSPPNTGTSDMFPLPPTPSVLFPGEVIDAHLRYDALESAGVDLAGTEVAGAVVLLKDLVVPEGLQSSFLQKVQILSVATPFELSGPVTSDHPVQSHLSDIPQSRYTSYTPAYEQPEARSQAVETLRWAFSNSRLVDIDVQCDVMSDVSKYEVFEDLLTKATADIGGNNIPIILSNILPPPHDLSLPIVKLLAHPSYRNYQGHSAALSLFPNLYVKFTPPMWNQAVPSAGDPTSEMDQHREWKRKIKMFIGPVLEAFGYERIIFGTSPSFATSLLPDPADWYALVRESFAELAVEQEAIDAIFSLNAKKIYGPC